MTNFCKNCGEEMQESSKKCEKCGSKAGSAIERAKKEPLIRREEGSSRKEEIRKQLNPMPRKTVDDALRERREQWRERVVPMSHPSPQREEVPEELPTETSVEPTLLPEPFYAEEVSARKKSKAPIALLILLIAAGTTVFFLWKHGMFAKKPSEPTEVISTEQPKTSTETESENGEEKSPQGETGNEEGEGVKIDESKVYNPSKADESKPEEGGTEPTETETEPAEPTGETEPEDPSGTEAPTTDEPKNDPAEPTTKETKKEEPSPEPLPPVGAGTYLLPDSATRRLTEADLTGMTREQLRLARNEIYARRGRKFSDKSLKDYFGAQAWYRGRISGRDFNEKTMLNLVEQANVEVIKSYEKKMGYQSE